MATTVAAPPEKLILTGLSWETYQRLLTEHEGRNSPRFTFDRGELEIMVISFEHEELNRLLHDLFTVIADEYSFAIYRRQSLAAAMGVAQPGSRLGLPPSTLEGGERSGRGIEQAR